MNQNSAALKALIDEWERGDRSVALSEWLAGRGVRATLRTSPPFIPDDSPVRRPPEGLSRRQLLILDGLRFAAEMATLAYERLTAELAAIARMQGPPSTRAIASAMLDAWSIVDAVHRFNDLCWRIFPDYRMRHGAGCSRDVSSRLSS